MPERPDPLAGIAAARTPEALRLALEAARAAGTPAEAVPVLLVERYLHLAGAGPRRDPGAVMRIEIVRTLDGWPAHDLAVYRRALRTYEWMPPADTEVCAPLRAAALAAIAHADPDLAAYEAVLHLPDADKMTREPALTAVRVLGALGLPQPLYALVVGGAPEEVTGEALRHLSELPLPLAEDLLEGMAAAEGVPAPVVLAGLVDLVLGHRDGAHLRPRLLELLATARSAEVVGYAAAAAVARRDREFFDALAGHRAISGDRALAGAVGEAGRLW